MSASPALPMSSTRRGRRDGIDTVTLVSSGLEATFAPGAGMICCSLLHRGEELLGQRRGLIAYATTGKTMGIPLLHPWANRLGDWSYEALGKRADLRRVDELVGRDAATGLPIHGALPAPWRVDRAEAGDDAARLVAEQHRAWDPSFRGAFPFDHRVRLEAWVSDAVLRMRVVIEPVEGPVPVTIGFHPYLTLPGLPREEYELELPVRRRLLLGPDQVPTGETQPVSPYAGPLGSRGFDDGYDELDDPAVFAVSGGGRRIELRFEQGFSVAQVFAQPGMDFVCFEPMTARTNALRTGDFPVATPDEPFEAAFSISIADA
jgi:aldose 1-epimerase